MACSIPFRRGGGPYRPLGRALGLLAQSPFCKGGGRYRPPGRALAAPREASPRRNREAPGAFGRGSRVFCFRSPLSQGLSPPYRSVGIGSAVPFFFFTVCTVCAFMGDGGLQMTMQELGTVMEQKSPVKIILMNNNYLGNVRQWQAMFFNRRYSFTPMMNPDYMQIASAYGIASRRVMSREELNDGIQEMLSTDGPFLLEVCVVEEGNVLPITPPGSSVNYMLMEC